jgi:hypothetical protein
VRVINKEGKFPTVPNAHLCQPTLDFCRVRGAAGSYSLSIRKKSFRIRIPRTRIRPLRYNFYHYFLLKNIYIN